MGKYVKARWPFLLFALIITVIGIFFFTQMRRDPNLAQASVALGTLILAMVTAFSVDANRRQEKRRMRLELLNAVATWAADIRKYCARLVLGFNTPQERSEATDKYLALKFDGRRLLTTVEKEEFSGELSGAMSKATGFFDGLDWNSLADHKDRLKELDAKSETVIREAINLIKAQ